MTVKTDSSLTKPDIYETRRIRLTSRLLHIGSAVPRLNPFEYVQTGSSVYLPNQDILAQVLKARGFLNNYIQRIEDRQEIVTLLEDALGSDWVTSTGAGDEQFFQSGYAFVSGQGSESPIYDR